LENRRCAHRSLRIVATFPLAIAAFEIRGGRKHVSARVDRHTWRMTNLSTFPTLPHIIIREITEFPDGRCDEEREHSCI